MLDRRDHIYAELGIPEKPEDPLDRWRRMKAEREEPKPRERKLDVAPPTLAEIDQRIGERIAAEHEFMMAIIAEVLGDLRREWVVGTIGPPGPSGPPGEQGPPGKLPLVVAQRTTRDFAVALEADIGKRWPTPLPWPLFRSMLPPRVRAKERSRGCPEVQ